MTGAGLLLRLWVWAALLSVGARGAEVSLETLVPDARLRDDAKLTAVAAAFAKGYGEDFEGVGRDAEGTVIFRLRGRDFIYDDGRRKSFEEMLESPDIEDCFRQVYPLEIPVDLVEEDFDPGRARVEEMFKALYGDTAEEVARACVTIDFLGHKVLFSTRCGAAAALEKSAADLRSVLLRKPELKVYFEKLGGTLNWRFIAGTTRLSNHSFGNAIDLNTDKAAYWRWDSPAKRSTFSRKSWPVEIVEVFERHGFIWGGKWHHYDTMHFEYRPELLAYARALKEKEIAGDAEPAVPR